MHACPVDSTQLCHCVVHQTSFPEGSEKLVLTYGAILLTAEGLGPNVQHNCLPAQALGEVSENSWAGARRRKCQRPVLSKENAALCLQLRARLSELETELGSLFRTWKTY